ncbi:hypothetical protein SAMN05192558_106150 [Actinokineospora alba]|uniref:F-box domain-containing protein n=1 Tax=Actinokineospora alba TaxID=504798 RepID=A0A1H0PKN8_9PSEU|nr:hypothetical protein [Actinokineospora alba]TDP65826.1 hypothetical protein C8E96_1317 [Actinokineospora alba]SDI64248.1 hypothetical protein SAMN05421871_106302 [Actinokineospora alba]SDP05179.1 hypothetical protein SAMN05192558_106150 [Actinokineospora alba]
MNPTSYLDTLPTELQQQIVNQLDADSVATLAMQVSAMRMREVALTRLQAMQGGLQALNDAMDRELQQIWEDGY